MPLQRAQGLKMQFKMTWSLLWNGKVAVETMAFTKKTPLSVRGVSDYEFIFLQLMLLLLKILPSWCNPKVWQYR